MEVIFPHKICKAQNNIFFKKKSKVKTTFNWDLILVSFFYLVITQESPNVNIETINLIYDTIIIVNKRVVIIINYFIKIYPLSKTHEKLFSYYNVLKLMHTI